MKLTKREMRKINPDIEYAITSFDDIAKILCDTPETLAAISQGVYSDEQVDDLFLGCKKTSNIKSFYNAVLANQYFFDKECQTIMSDKYIGKLEVVDNNKTLAENVACMKARQLNLVGMIIYVLKGTYFGDWYETKELVKKFISQVERWQKKYC